MPCTGCNLDFEYFNTSLVRNYGQGTGPVNTASWAPTQLFSLNLYGDGQGALTGITGYPLGTLTIHASQRSSGLCQNVTGIVVTGIYTGNPMYENDFTGNVSHVYRTGCDQRDPCRIGKLWFEFSGNSDLYVGAPSARTSIHGWFFGATNGIREQSYGTLSSGNSSIPSGALSMTNTRIDCGKTYNAYIITQTLIPGYTGEIFNQVVVNLKCRPCSN